MIQEQITKLTEEKAKIEAENVNHMKASFDLKILLKWNERRLKAIDQQLEELKALDNGTE
jgi:hypothetical protein